MLQWIFQRLTGMLKNLQLHSSEYPLRPSNNVQFLTWFQLCHMYTLQVLECLN